MNIKSNTTINGLRVCLCGCQEYVAGKALYRPGHDARHVSITFKFVVELAQEANDVNEQRRVQDSLLALFAQLGSEKLQEKLGRMIDNSKHGIDLSFGDSGIYIPFSDNQALGNSGEVYNQLFEVVQVFRNEEPVKIGRWSYPARFDMTSNTTFRNTKTDGSGEWVAV